MSNQSLTGAESGFKPHGVQGIRLKSILPKSRFVGGDSFRVQSCCGHWNEVQQDDLYVAIVDADNDGHDYAEQAITRGAGAVLTERLLAIDRPQCIVPDSRIAYGKISQALAGNPSRHATAIGVSGTDGKTVTSHLVQSILQQANFQTGLASSIQTGWDDYVDTRVPEHVNSPTLAANMAKMVLNGCSHMVLEAPNDSLANHSFSGVELDVAVLTNVRRDHLTHDASPKNYMRVKTRMLDYLKPTGFAIINADDPLSRDLLDEIDKPTLTYGIHQSAEVSARMIDRWPAEQTFMIRAGGQSVPVRTGMIGKQHIYNCLAATSVGLTLGIDLATIARGIEQASEIPGRMQVLRCGQPFGVWIDSAHTPSQLATALRAIRGVVDGQIWCVVSTADGQSSLHRKQMGQVAERAGDQCVLTRSDSSHAIDFEPIHQMLDGFSESAKPQIIPNRFKAIQWALSNARPGDAVLISGKGQLPFALVGQQAWPVSDREVAEAWLYDNNSLEDPGDDDSPQSFNIDDYR